MTLDRPSKSPVGTPTIAAKKYPARNGSELASRADGNSPDRVMVHAAERIALGGEAKSGLIHGAEACHRPMTTISDIVVIVQSGIRDAGLFFGWAREISGALDNLCSPLIAIVCLPETGQSDHRSAVVQRRPDLVTLEGEFGRQEN